jgi:hypothetical protein
MSWLSEYVGDPLKKLLAEVVADGAAELKVLAGEVAKDIPATPITAAAEVAFETTVQDAFDGGLSSVVGEIPVAGAALAPQVVKDANAAVDYLVQKGVASLNALAAQAKAKLSALAALPAEASAGAAIGAAATATATSDPLNPTAADIAAQAAT